MICTKFKLNNVHVYDFIIHSTLEGGVWLYRAYIHHIYTIYTYRIES